MKINSKLQFIKKLQGSLINSEITILNIYGENLELIKKCAQISKLESIF